MEKKIYLADYIKLSKDARDNGVDIYNEVYDLPGVAFCISSDSSDTVDPYYIFLDILANSLEIKNIAEHGLIVNMTGFVTDNKQKMEQLFDMEFDDEVFSDYMERMISGNANEDSYKDFVDLFTKKEKSNMKLFQCDYKDERGNIGTLTIQAESKQEAENEGYDYLTMELEKQAEITHIIELEEDNEISIE